MLRLTHRETILVSEIAVLSNAVLYAPVRGGDTRGAGGALAPPLFMLPAASFAQFAIRRDPANHAHPRGGDTRGAGGALAPPLFEEGGLSPPTFHAACFAQFAIRRDPASHAHPKQIELRMRFFAQPIAFPTRFSHMRMYTCVDHGKEASKSCRVVRT